jgi:hypothetical protein
LVNGKAERVTVAVGVGPGGVAVGVLVLVEVLVGVGVLLGNVGKGDGVTDGFSVLNGCGVAEGKATGGVQVGANGGSVAVGVAEGSSTTATSVGSSLSGAKAAGMASVGKNRLSCKKAISGIRSGAIKNKAARAATPTETSSSNAATTLINLPAHPVCCFRLLVILLRGFRSRYPLG